jgi:hypothetical protein
MPLVLAKQRASSVCWFTRWIIIHTVEEHKILEIHTADALALEHHSPTLDTVLAQLHCLNRSETSDIHNGIRNMFEGQMRYAQAFVTLQSCRSPGLEYCMKRSVHGVFCGDQTQMGITWSECALISSKGLFPVPPTWVLSNSSRRLPHFLSIFF